MHPDTAQPNAADGPSDPLAPIRSSVHVWRISLLQPPGIVEDLERTLSDEEIARANRFHFARDRRSFIIARGALRSILARYLAAKPSQIQFSTGSYGKPFLLDGRIKFNLSHSGGLGLLAVTAERELGVDVEQIKPLRDMLDIAKRFFSVREAAKFAAVAGTNVADLAFFNCWTRKEAFIKAVGEGLSHPLDTFEVTFLPGEPVELRAPLAERAWELTTIAVREGYSAALVVEASEHHLSGDILSFDWAPHLESSFRHLAR